MKEMTTREVQMISLDILKDVHEFCVNNDIKYSLCGGTLIGAIRHNGFIPWDDDADIVMPRPEYDKFINTYKTNKKYKLFSQKIREEEEVRIRITKICDMEKTYVDNGRYAWTEEEVGVGIDIIPADGAPDNQYDAERQIKRLRRMDYILSLCRTRHANIKTIKRYHSEWMKVKFILKKIIGYLVPKGYTMKMIKFQSKYDYKSSNYFCAGYMYGIGEWQSKKIFEDFELHKFEDTYLYVTKYYDQYLKSLFGNYMTLPPESERVSHDFYKYYWRD